MTGPDPPDAGGGSLPKRRLGDFEILSEVGRGGMGIVYEARQLSLDRVVALKVLPPGLGLTPQAVRRFEREARAAARLHHTNIVPVHAIGQEAGCHYYAMELIEGQSLAEVLDGMGTRDPNALLEETVTLSGDEATARTVEDSNPSTKTPSSSGASTSSRKWFDTVARLVAEVADALEYSHLRGVIHRDIKPANLLLSHEGRLCIGDFGLARIAQEPGMTATGSLLGTPAYMSPEQVSAGRIQIDHRTDVYSLGAVLYEMLTLRRPFEGDSREEVLSAILTRDPRPPRRINSRVPTDLETICLKALEKDPSRRYPSAAALAHDLRQYLQRGLIAARRAGLLRRGWKLARRHPAVATAGLAAVLIVVIGAFAWWTVVQKKEETFRRDLAEARFAVSQGQYRDALAKADAVLAVDPVLAEARLIRVRSLLHLQRGQQVVTESQAALDEDPDDWLAHAVLAALARSDDVFYGGDVERHVKAMEELAPETADAYMLRALLANTAAEALPLFDRALELDPGHVESLMLRAERHRDLKNYDAALADAERLIAATPRSARGRQVKALCYQGLHDGRNALAEIERAIAIDPDDPVSYAHRSDIYNDMFADPTRALADLTTATEIDPGSPLLFHRRAQAQLAADRFEEAVADAQRARDLDPANPSPLQVQIRAYMRLGNDAEVDRLLEEYEKVIDETSDPGAVNDLHMLRADVFSSRGDHPRALAEIDRALELAPESWSFMLTRANTRRFLGDDIGAAADCDRVVSVEIDEPSELLGRAGPLYGNCQRLDLALADYSRAIELAPGWADPYLWRGDLYAVEKHFEEGLADMGRAIELAPQWALAHSIRGRHFLWMERFEEALRDFDRCIDLGDRGLWTLRRRAGALFGLRRNEEAFRELKRAAELSPQSSLVHRWRAGAFYRLGRVGEALEAIEQAIETEPASPWGYLARAAYLFSMRDRCGDGMADLRRGLELGKDTQPGVWNSVSWQQVAHVIHACPDGYAPEEALTMIQRAVDVDPLNSAMADTLGLALYRNGRYAEARAHLLRALDRQFQPAPETLLSLAMTHWKLGRKSEARSYYDLAFERIAKTYPAHPEYLSLKEEASRVLGVYP